MKGFVRYEPEKLWNYSPVIKPMPPLLIDNICCEPSMCLQVSCEFIPYLLGLLEIYRWPDRFSGTPEEQEHSAGLFRDLMKEVAMSCNDGSVNLTVVLHQVNTVTFGLEISIDGGETWQPDPEDPRNLIVALPPPVPAGVAADLCEAATLGTVHLQEIKDAITPLVGLTISLFALALEVLLAILAVWIGNAKADSLVALVMAVVKALQEATLEEWNGIWTQEVWDKVLCALYCHMSPDGTFTDEGYAGLVNELQGNLPGGSSAMGARSWVHVFLTVLGRTGVNNICAYGDPQGADCSACTCGCDVDLWGLLDGSHGTIVDRQDDWIEVAASETVPGQWYIILTTGDPNLCCLVDSALYEYTSGSCQGCELAWFECGTYYPEEVTFGLMGERCTPLVQIQSQTPFTVKIHFAPCV